MLKNLLVQMSLKKTLVHTAMHMDTSRVKTPETICLCCRLVNIAIRVRSVKCLLQTVTEMQGRWRCESVKTWFKMTMDSHINLPSYFLAWLYMAITLNSSLIYYSMRTSYFRDIGWVHRPGYAHQRGKWLRGLGLKAYGGNFSFRPRKNWCWESVADKDQDENFRAPASASWIRVGKIV